MNELTVGEAALLAGLIRTPRATTRSCDPEGASNGGAALERMVDQGYITQEQAATATNEPLPTRVKPTSELRPGTSWAEEIQDVSSTTRVYRCSARRPKERQDRVLNGGLKVYTTKDPAMEQPRRRGGAGPAREAGLHRRARRDGSEDRRT